MFYVSNTDTYDKPKLPGWYIGYTTESGDDSYIGPFKTPFKDDKHALEILKDKVHWEWENGEFYAEVTFFIEIK